MKLTKDDIISTLCFVVVIITIVFFMPSTKSTMTEVDIDEKIPQGLPGLKVEFVNLLELGIEFTNNSSVLMKLLAHGTDSGGRTR